MIELLNKLNIHWAGKRYEVRDREVNFKMYKTKILFILGIRRVGKTSFIKNMIGKLIDEENVNPYHILYLDFFNVLLTQYTDAVKLIHLIEKYAEEFDIPLSKLYIFIDEIQEVREWWKVLEYFRGKCFIIATGSSSTLMHGDIGKYLVGRYIKIELSPLSFREYLVWKSISLRDLKFKDIREKVLRSYIYSALPEYVIYEEEQFIIDTYNDIIHRDIFLKYNIREKRAFKELAYYLLNEITNYYTYNSLKKIFKLHENTLSEFLFYLESSYLFYSLYPYTTKIKVQVNAPRKIYIVDNGFFNIIKAKTTLDIGKLMENLVFVELRRKYQPNEGLFYYKTKEGYEVDFLIKEGTRIKELVQVSYANSYEEINEREIRALLHAKEDLKLGEEVKLTVITWDYEDEKQVEWWRKKGRIRFVPLWKWLLEERSESL